MYNNDILDKRNTQLILNTLNFSAACEIEVPGSDNLVITGGHAGISQPGNCIANIIELQLRHFYISTSQYQ